MDKDIIIARNPENELDACWFTSEDEAFSHYCDWSDDYTYTQFNDVEGWSRCLDDDFADRQHRARSACRHERMASVADDRHQARMEAVHA